MVQCSQYCTVHCSGAKEVFRTIAELKLEKQVHIYVGQERERLLKEMQEIFVEGNPQVWWLRLKYKPESYVFEVDEPWKEIRRFFDRDEEVYFIIEDADIFSEQLLCKAKISQVIEIVDNSEMLFEYNLISINYDRFMCETDHDEYLFIDRRGSGSSYATGISESG